MEYLFELAWRHWVHLFADWGLPWSAHATATAAAVVSFYFLGIAYKILTSKEL
jgi:hypothetical protein